MKTFVLVLTAAGPAICVEIGKLVYRMFSLASFPTFGWWFGLIISFLPVWFIFTLHEAYFEYKGDKHGKADKE